MAMETIHIFTDGSSRGNPGPGGWASVLVSQDNVLELGGREDDTTNNRMELKACEEALVAVSQNRLGASSVSQNVIVHTDSRYVQNGIEKWVYGWMKNGWKTQAKEDVANRDLWENLVKAKSSLKNVRFEYVGGHIGIPGNERCDEIATSFADGETVELYSGNVEGYKVENILKFDGETVKQEKKSKKREGVAYSYLSLVNGILVKHATWPECEARVKGVKGAKFKKSLSAVDEQEIIASWGIK